MTASSPTVTIIVPVYNADGYLRTSIESILKQTFEDMEILIFDDGSTDGCMDTIADVDDPRITVISQENTGKPTIMNRAIAMARGEFYAVQDADDISAPTRIARLVACMREFPHLAGAFSGYDLILNDRRYAPRTPNKDEAACSEDVHAFTMPSHDPTAIYRLSLVRGVKYDVDLPIGEGLDYIMKVGERHPLRVIGDCLYSYRIHDASITRRNPSEKSRLVRVALKRACDRRGISFERVFGPDDESHNGPLRLRNRDRDNNLAAHFVESVNDLKRQKRRLAAIRTGLQCAALHPLDPDYHKALMWTVLPTPVVDFVRSSRQNARRRRADDAYAYRSTDISGTLRVFYSFPHVLGRPGIGSTAWYQIQGLIDAGAEVHVYCSACERPLRGAATLRETLKLQRWRVPRRVFGSDRAWHLHDWVCSRILARESRGFDTVHCWPSGALQTLRVAKSRGIRSFLERPSAHTRYVNAVAESESERLGIAKPARHYSGITGQRLAREEREFNAADMLLCPSPFVIGTFHKFGFDVTRLRLHQYGFDHSIFYPARRQSPSSFTALYCGEGIALKGLHIAVRAWLDSDVHASGGRLLIAGTVMPAIAQALKEELSHSSIQVLGFRTDIPDVMRDSDVLLLPSFAEGSALVTYEAQACGCVPLVSDASGARCIHEETGLVHEAGDQATLGRQIRLLNADPTVLDALRQRTLADAPRWTWARAGQVLLALYRAQMATAHSRAPLSPFTQSQVSGHNTIV